MSEPAALLALDARRSVPSRQLGEPGPDAATLLRMLQSAVRVPDHGKRVPFRFVRIAGSARARLGAQAVIGITCHDSLALAQAAADGGSSYLAFGAMFASTSKPQARTCPLPVLTEARRRFSLPLVAIGGITPDNACEVAAAGADALAVIAALWQAADIRAAATALARTYSPAMSRTT